jgi:hypothetical protein
VILHLKLFHSGREKSANKVDGAPKIVARRSASERQFGRCAGRRATVRFAKRERSVTQFRKVRTDDLEILFEVQTRHSLQTRRVCSDFYRKVDSF